MALSVVVPVFNAEGTLRTLVTALANLGETIPLEVILVNDGSRDRSWEVILELAAKHSWVLGINLMKNYGQHNALLCGVRAARHDLVATIDDDLQNPPEEIPAMLSKLREGYDVVYGCPVRETHGLLRDFASRITKIVLQGAMGASTARQVSAFRVFRTELRKAFANYTGPYVSLDVLLTWGTNRFASIRVEHRPRLIGVSNYTWRKLMTHALNMVTGFSTLPLRFASILGFAFTLFGAAILCYVLIRFLIEGGSVPGFPFLASIVAIFSGAQLFALGIMGEYLARLHSRMLERPSYTIQSTSDARWPAKS
jgi:glycosyltransferase involved in cell wall biosynthesis